ncbi:Holliday junction resolvase RecU [Mesomycoplasma conjunctivae]|uniref:Holliday junction resolvase RecU n=1 Tax=Mesomycoplasma conjunctivae TaxID=45361 RepID=UPI003DA5C892
MNHKNRGMILETIINNTIDFYNRNGVAIFHKKNLDISFKKIGKDLSVKKGMVLKKSTVDYYGIYNGIFVAFEAKSTNENLLNIKQIPDHQIQYLEQIKKHKGCAFFIIFFKKYEQFFILDISKFDKTEKSISVDFLKKNGIEVILTYPGIIDFVEHIGSMV